jgi:hypothetical protein
LPEEFPFLKRTGFPSEKSPAIVISTIGEIFLSLQNKEISPIVEMTKQTAQGIYSSHQNRKR